MNIAINKASSAFPAHDDMMCLLVALYCSTLIKVSDHVSHCYNLTAHAQKVIACKSFVYKLSLSIQSRTYCLLFSFDFSCIS